jgi:hypothetical protein
VLDAREIREGPKGTIFVSTLFVANKVYAFPPGKREPKVIIDKLPMAAGIALDSKGNLYVGTNTKIVRYDNIEDKLDNPGEPKVIYETVVKVAERAGVRAHAHALRAAFAVNFLEQHPGRIESLQKLMGHDRIETTMVYLRRMNRAKAVDDVPDLSLGNPLGFEPRTDRKRDLQAKEPAKAHTGFEPVFDPTRGLEPETLPNPLAAVLARLRAEQQPTPKRVRGDRRS